MIYNQISSMLDMIKKMAENKEDSNKILQFLNSVLPEMKKTILSSDIKTCTNCGLFACNHVIPYGNSSSEIMFVLEAPNEQEEKEGVPFVGSTGILFANMLAVAADKLNLRWSRENIYITNTIKCRPIEGNFNRRPNEIEIAACKRFLDKEIELINPKIIICVGSVAASTLIHPKFNIEEEQGKFFGDSPKFIAMFHPTDLLKNGEHSPGSIQLKIKMWEVIVAANEYLES